LGKLVSCLPDEAEAIFATSRMFTDTVSSKNAPTTKYGTQIAGL